MIPSEEPTAWRPTGAAGSQWALVLVTRNTADFAAFEGLEVRDWFSQP